MNTDKGQIKAVDIVTGDIPDDLKKQTRAKSQMTQLKL